MRTGLIAAVSRTEAGALRAELPLAGQSVLAWQVDLLRDLGAERILCLCEGAAGEVLRLQHAVEAGGAAFHAISGFAALPALVRAEDELIILRDGLVPDPTLVRALMVDDAALKKGVLCLPAAHPLSVGYSEHFERIDAARHWAGVLVMRGAAVQQLADFPADANAVSVLLRLALQSGTPCRDLTPSALAPDTWLLADSAKSMMAHEQRLFANAVPKPDWRAPLMTLAVQIVRRAAPRGLAYGGRMAMFAALMMGLGGVLIAAFGMAAGGLAVAAAGVFAARVSSAYAAMNARLRRQSAARRTEAVGDLVIDVLSALTVWFALAPWLDWTPLAVCGPLTIGLARLAARAGGPALAAFASDRASILLVLTLAASLGFLSEAIAALALALLAALLLRKAPN